MNYYYIPNAPISEEQGDQISSEENIAARRGRDKRTTPQSAAYAGTAAGGLLSQAIGDAAKTVVWNDLGKTMGNEFQEIRENPELRAKEMSDLIQTYQNFVNKTGNPVEYFQDMPGTNKWAAGRLPNGDDVVWWDSTAPHATVMAHELGHVNMNHANPILDPLAGLQTSGIGRFSGNNAAGIGAGGAALGALIGALKGGPRQYRNQIIGTTAGGALGTIGGSGQFAYELGGASGRALDYLPEEDDKIDAAGDLIRAGMTYGMAGPATAAIAAIGAGAGAAALGHPAVKRFAGASLKRWKTN